MKLMNKTSLVMEPRASVELDVTGERYRTPVEWQVNPGGIAAFEGVRAEARVKLVQSAQPAAGEITVAIVTGATTLGQVVIDLTGAQSFNRKIPLSGSALETGVPLELVVTGNTAADASTTAEIDAVVDIETPILLTGC